MADGRVLSWLVLLQLQLQLMIVAGIAAVDANANANANGWLLKGVGVMRLPDLIATTSDGFGNAQGARGATLLDPLALSAVSGRRWWLYDKK